MADAVFRQLLSNFVFAGMAISGTYDVHGCTMMASIQAPHMHVMHIRHIFYIQKLLLQDSKIHTFWRFDQEQIQGFLQVPEGVHAHKTSHADGQNGIGQIITPDCDTIGDVVQLSYRRVGTTHVFDDFNSSFGNTKDSTLIDTQNIEKRLATDSISHQISRNVWYAPGYRYPIVESRQYVLMYYNTPVDTSMVTFYFPPQSQEFDLETDAVNELLRQEIKNMTYQSVTPKSRNINDIRAIPDNGASDEQTMSLHANVDCNLYPTVVNGKTTAHISTDDRATINMSLLNSSGALLWEHDNDIEAGQYKIDCDMSNYISGNYVMIITINNEKFSYKLIKP